MLSGMVLSFPILALRRAAGRDPALLPSRVAAEIIDKHDSMDRTPRQRGCGDASPERDRFLRRGRRTLTPTFSLGMRLSKNWLHHEIAGMKLLSEDRMDALSLTRD